MKITKVYRREYLLGVPCLGNELILSGKWKTVITNNSYHLEFEVISGNWYSDENIIVITTEEFINECSSTMSLHG